jgi:hypothetical protein
MYETLPENRARLLTAKGESARPTTERGIKELSASLTDRKDVISKKLFEQHLFTQRPKY